MYSSDLGFAQQCICTSQINNSFPWSILLSTIRNDVKMFQTRETTSHRQVVSLQSFQHFDIISMDNKSTDLGKLLLIFFTIPLTVLMPISVEISWKILCQRKGKTNCAANITSFPWFVFLLNITLDQSARKKSLSYCKNTIFQLRSLFDK